MKNYGNFSPSFKISCTIQNWVLQSKEKNFWRVILVLGDITWVCGKVSSLYSGEINL